MLLNNLQVLVLGRNLRFDTKKCKTGRRFSTWNARSLNRPGSLKTVARELSRNRLDEGVVQDFRWEKAGSVRAEDCTGCSN